MKNIILYFFIVLLIIVIIVAFKSNKSPVLNYTEGEHNQIETIEYVNSLVSAQKFTTKESVIIDKIKYADLNNDGNIGISDLTWLIGIVKDKPHPIPKKGDVNGDCSINYDDVWYYATWMFNDGPVPIKPCSIL